MTARSMGKNDLWIAATASVLGLTLLTSDKDFHHLDGIYFDIAFIDLASL
jgi:tRNA(fMet)-specific endonuclease VapC